MLDRFDLTEIARARIEDAQVLLRSNGEDYQEELLRRMVGSGYMEPGNAI